MTVTPDGIPVSNRVDTTTERKLHAMVVDNILNSTTLESRMMGMAKQFRGKTADYTLKITNSGAGQFVVGLENLAMNASDTTITLSFAHTAFTQPIVIPMLEAFANTGPEGTIDLSMFKVDEAQAESINRVGIAAYGTGSGGQPLGLEAIVDNGTNTSTIGGQSRSTYTVLNDGYQTAATTLSFAKMGNLEDGVRAAGIDSERPSVYFTTKTAWSLFEQLHNREVRAEYATIGYNMLPVRGTSLVKAPDLKGGAGFTALTFRGKPVVDDDNATSGVMYALNERYTFWLGRSIVPPLFRDFLEKVSLGKPKTIEGVSASTYEGMPSAYNGWFYQKLMISPSQAAAIARYWVIGQMVVSQPRRNGKLTGITTI